MYIIIIHKSTESGEIAHLHFVEWSGNYNVYVWVQFLPCEWNNRMIYNECMWHSHGRYIYDIIQLSNLQLYKFARPLSSMQLGAGTQATERVH